VREHVVHLASEALPLAENSRACLRVAGVLELAQELLGLVLPLREPSGQTRHDVEGDHPELLQHGAEDALVLADHLGDGKCDKRERDDRNAGPAAHAHRRGRDGDERAEKRRTLRLQRDERRRAQHEHGEGGRLRRRGFQPGAHRAEDTDRETDEREQDAEMLAAQAGARMGLDPDDLHEHNRRDAERSHPAQHHLLARACVLERRDGWSAHERRVCPPDGHVIGG
jgi:hypothetical protein